MKFLFLFSVIYVSVKLSDALPTNGEEINWNTLSVHKEIDTSIVQSTKQSDNIIQCATACSNQPPKDRVSLYYIPETGVCHCNVLEDLKPKNTSANLIQYGTPELDNSDCSALYAYGYTKDGVYSIKDWLGGALYVQCDMTNGGWTVIQQRFDGSVDFQRNWVNYTSGFGDVNGEHWMGLDNIHHLTKSDSELSVYMEVFPGVTPPNMSALYSYFTIGDSTAKYILFVDGYSGTCGDSITGYQTGMKFTTFDNDNDNYRFNCAKSFKGGWWHKACFRSNLNGRYYQAGEYNSNSTFALGLHWFRCWNFDHSAKTTIMKVRRK